MLRKSCGLVLALLTLGIVVADTATLVAQPGGGAAVGRYQLVSATRTEIIVLDTVTGDLFVASPSDLKAFNLRTKGGGGGGLAYKKRADFPSDQAYGAYIKSQLKVGMRVRAIADYEKVNKGLTGTYYGTENYSPDCLVCWDKDLASVSLLLPAFPKDKARNAYWVFFYQVEIID